MSEDFDREAEKERLREKLETEEDGRQTTEHMSELLLKGATMTNRHCEECGDPIFRYDGQEFCPTCQKEVQHASGEAEQTREAGGHSEPAGEASQSQGAAAGTTPTDQPPQQGSGASTEQTHGTDRPGQSRTGQQAAGGQHDQAGSSTTDARVETAGDLTAARGSLVRTLTRLASEAEQTTDVGRTRDLLAAAREAAEAIAALDRADR